MSLKSAQKLTLGICGKAKQTQVFIIFDQLRRISEIVKLQKGEKLKIFKENNRRRKRVRNVCP